MSTAAEPAEPAQRGGATTARPAADAGRPAADPAALPSRRALRAAREAAQRTDADEPAGSRPAQPVASESPEIEPVPAALRLPSLEEIAAVQPRPRQARRQVAPARPAVSARPVDAPRAARARRRVRSLRSPFVLCLAIPGLLATVGLPAYALSDDGSLPASASAQLSGVVDGQSLQVSADSTSPVVERDGYSTTNRTADVSAQAANGASGHDAGAALDGYMNASDEGWWRPLPGPITSPYGPRSLICNGAGCSNAFHEGIDFGNDCGTPIRAAGSGEVTFVGNAGGFGNRVIVDTGDGVSTIYGHLLTGSASVAVGDTVEAGQVIAEVGATGVVNGCHLDLKVEIDGETTDPAEFLREKGVTV